MVAKRPDQLASVIVQKTVKDDRGEKAVSALGGKVTKDLHIINALVADITAEGATQLVGSSETLPDSYDLKHPGDRW